MRLTPYRRTFCGKRATRIGCFGSILDIPDYTSSRFRQDADPELQPRVAEIRQRHGLAPSCAEQLVRGRLS
jgi:hypothetical protein